jgi:hypothetical protein
METNKIVKLIQTNKFFFWLHERKKKKGKQKKGLHPHNRHTPCISLKQVTESSWGVTQ